jgi:hypothetical protein
MLHVVRRSEFLYGLVNQYRQAREVKHWERSGRGVPLPHRLKQEIVTAYGERFGLHVLVETGTCSGTMVEAQRRKFRRIWSIELNPDLAQRCKTRFRSESSVEIVQGDSAIELPRFLASLREPALFWLDAHYSGGVTAKGDSETPIEAELTLVLSHSDRHVVLVDDARYFDGTHDYPTLDAVRALTRRIRPDHRVSVEDDIIRIHA